MTVLVTFLVIKAVGHFCARRLDHNVPQRPQPPRPHVNIPPMEETR